MSFSRVINQNSPHRLGGDAEKMGAVLPVDFALVNQFQIGFVNQRGRPQSVFAAFAAQIPRGLPVQFRVDERQQRV